MNIAANTLVNASPINAFSTLNRLKQTATADGAIVEKPALLTGQARTIASSDTRTPPAGSGDPCQGGAPSTATPLNPLTLKELQAAFGTSNKRCDLDGNGTVDIDDLVTFINSQPVPGANAINEPVVTDSIAPASTSPVETQPAIPAAGTPQGTTLTIEGFNKVWGQSGSEYDINGDGTVNMDDLVQFIASQSTPTPTSAAIASPPAPVNAETSADAAQDPAAVSAVATKQPHLTLDGLLAAWSNPSDNSTRSDSPYDLNGDGQVNMDDLTAFINSMSPGRSTTLDGSANSSRNGAAGTSPKKSDLLITKLTDRLDKLGFVNQPPVNIRELIDAMDLSPAQSNSAIRQLQQRYPKGLGVNLLG